MTGEGAFYAGRSPVRLADAPRFLVEVVVIGQDAGRFATRSAARAARARCRFSRICSRGFIPRTGLV